MTKEDKNIDELLDELAKEHQEFWDKVKDKRFRDLTRDELREYVSMCLEGMIKVRGDK